MAAHHWRSRRFCYKDAGRNTDLLILKLTIVPLALLLLGIADRLHGPRVAGWLAGFPVVAGPLLLFITLDLGPAFGSAAALGAYFGLVPWLAFTMSYAASARHLAWPWCTAIALAAWTLAAFASILLQDGPAWLEILPFLLMLAAILLYPRGPVSDEEREHGKWGLPIRMVAGAALTVVITRFAATLGTHWSGIFTTFPVMGSIICISSHIQHGRQAVRDVVGGMTLGLTSVASFCFALYWLLPAAGTWPAFGLALAVCTLAMVLAWLLLRTGDSKAA
ncbi:MAG TPA: hypothetical protein VFQ69_09725 [Rhizomicrobium sp.]|jgi:TM2 domain-containing membrane protein YozV|nr:hypothetical protein [Rhizomicrobium sp.]